LVENFLIGRRPDGRSKNSDESEGFIKTPTMKIGEVFVNLSKEK
jgi:hypothetical protein